MPPPGHSLQLAPVPAASRREGANCYQCRHFAVSWDPRLPYQCRLMGFKSRQLPAIEVLRVDGVPCQGFSPKSDSSATTRAATSAPVQGHGAGCTLQLSNRLGQAADGADLPELRPGWAGRRAS